MDNKKPANDPKEIPPKKDPGKVNPIKDSDLKPGKNNPKDPSADDAELDF